MASRSRTFCPRTWWVRSRCWFWRSRFTPATRAGRPDAGARRTSSAPLALYLNVFVLVVQSFMKVPGLHALAPTQSEPPFVIAQLVVLVVFVGLGALAVRRRT